MLVTLEPSNKGSLKKYVTLFFGGGGTMSHRGGGGLKSVKKCHVLFEWSLDYKRFLNLISFNLLIIWVLGAHVIRSSQTYPERWGKRLTSFVWTCETERTPCAAECSGVAPTITQMCQRCLWWDFFWCFSPAKLANQIVLLGNCKHFQNWPVATEEFFQSW